MTGNGIIMEKKYLFSGCWDVDLLNFLYWKYYIAESILFTGHGGIITGYGLLFYWMWIIILDLNILLNMDNTLLDMD